MGAEMLTRSALRNPVGVLMASIAVVVLGWVSLGRIPVDLFPDINIPVVMVGVVYPGAGPRDVEASITHQLERAISSVPNVTYVESASRQGLSVVRAYFDWDADVDTGATDCIQKVQQIMRSLPVGAQQPFVVKMDMSNFAVVGLTLSGGGLDERDLYDLAYNVVQPQIERLPGVSNAVLSGGLVRQINVIADRDAMRARGVTANDLVDALAQANFLLPSGSLKVGPIDYNVFSDTQIHEVERLGDVVVRLGGEGRNPVFVRDVATVEDGAEDRTSIVRVNGGPGVNLWVRKQPGANTVEVVDRVISELPNVHGLPPGVELRPAFDQASYIRNSIRSLVNEALMGAFLAVAVMFVFLRTFRSTAVIAVSIPLSIMATFLLLFFVGRQSINMFTLGGLALGVGRLVDDSIVVLENIFRHRGMGKPPLQAAVDGAGEVAMPVLASTVATIAVFFPVVFLSGIGRELFIPLTLSIVFSLAASYFVAMGVIPPLTLRAVRPEPERRLDSPRLKDRFMARWRILFESLDAFYAATLRRALRHRGPVAAVIAAAFAGAMALLPGLGTEFFPRTDESQFHVMLRAPLGTRVEITSEMMRVVEEAVRETLGEENITMVIADAGVRQAGGFFGGGNSGPHAGSVRVRLVPPDRRTFSDREAIERVRRQLDGKLPGVRVWFDVGGIVARVLNFGSEAPIDVEVRGYDLDVARRLARQVQAAVEATPGTSDVRTSREDDYPEINVRIDREKAAYLGTTTRAVAQSVLTSMAGNVNVPGIFTDPTTGQEYWIVVRLKEEDRASLADLEDVPVPVEGDLVASLRTLATIEPGAGPVQIDRKDQERIVHVTANVTGRPLGDVAADIEERLEAIEKVGGFTVTLGGERSQQKESFRGLLLALGLALMLVYMAMATQFRSLVEPFIVMFSVPMGMIGVVLALWATGTPLSINSGMGIIMMIGIVVSNGILLVEFANVKQASGLSPEDAVVEAGRTRLRPILMTTLTTLLGLLPMAIGIGEGSESNVPLARAVVGGLSASTVFTLILVPVLYTVLRRRVRPQLTDHQDA